MSMQYLGHPILKKFPLGDRGLLEGLPTKVIHDSIYQFSGLFEPTQLAKTVAEFVAVRTDATFETVLKEMERFISTAAQDHSEIVGPENRYTSTQKCWFKITVFTPDEDFQVPRWHRDGTLFDYTYVKSKLHCKYAFTLLGPPTRVLPPTPEIHEAWAKAERACEAENRELLAKEDLESWEIFLKKKRAFMAKHVQGFDTVKLEPGQIFRFYCGKEGPIHSEPDSSNEDRIFVSMFFGTEDEMANSHLGKEDGERIHGYGVRDQEGNGRKREHPEI